jgi:hypothetical protein
LSARVVQTNSPLSRHAGDPSLADRYDVFVMTDACGQRSVLIPYKVPSERFITKSGAQGRTLAIVGLTTILAQLS